MSYNEHILYLLGELGWEYNHFVNSVTNRLDKLSIEEIHSLLLNYEFRLDTQNSYK